MYIFFAKIEHLYNPSPLLPQKNPTTTLLFALKITSKNMTWKIKHFKTTVQSYYEVQLELKMRMLIPLITNSTDDRCWP